MSHRQTPRAREGAQMVDLAPRLRRQARDRRAEERARWEPLVAHARRAAARVLRLPPGHPDVEDRAQDALLLFLASGLPRFDAGRGTPEALVATIARNCALSHLRARSLRARTGERLAAEEGARAADGGQRRVEAARDLGRVLAVLRPAHAAALVEIDLEGERIGVVARREGRSYAAVNAEVGHARSHARRAARDLFAA
jgi:DNA-directed RNA polymerase specialized sigma24 family protein